MKVSVSVITFDHEPYIAAALDGILEKLGAPDWIGDVTGFVADGLTGNIPGAISSALDALEDAAEWTGDYGISDFLGVAADATDIFGGGAFNIGDAAGYADTAGGLLDLVGGDAEAGRLLQLLGSHTGSQGVFDMLGSFRA